MTLSQSGDRVNPRRCNRGALHVILHLKTMIYAAIPDFMEVVAPATRMNAPFMSAKREEKFAVPILRLEALHAFGEIYGCLLHLLLPPFPSFLLYSILFPSS